jgi:hypothetical protein
MQQRRETTQQALRDASSLVRNAAGVVAPPAQTDVYSRKFPSEDASLARRRFFARGPAACFRAARKEAP